LYWQRVYLDELTGLANFRALSEKLDKLSGTYTLAVVDVDYFAKFNDHYGVEQGDNAIRFVATQLSKTPGATLFRGEGPALCLVFENQNAMTVSEILEKARLGLFNEPFFLRAPSAHRAWTSPKNRGKLTRKTSVRITVSIGVGESTHSMSRGRDVFNAAESALFSAKQLGRNQVVLASSASLFRSA
jgi:diguanylate cyclase (GGDEF)-like protein